MRGMFTWAVGVDPAAGGALPALAIATVGALLGGCTASVIGSDGTLYVVGPALVSHAAEDGWSRTLSSALEIRTVGLSLHELDDGYAVSLGYTVLRSAGLRAGRVGAQWRREGAAREGGGRVGGHAGDKVSVFVGVGWSKQKQKWRARAGQVHVGFFEDEYEAAQVCSVLWAVGCGE